MEFFDYDSGFKPQKGDLLVSEPFLPDPNFERTVVLLCDHSETGTLGFIINKPSSLMLVDLMDSDDTPNEPTFVGGPVQQDTLHFIHRRDDVLDGMYLGNNLYWGGDYDKAKLLLLDGVVTSDQIRFFVGYSGWGESQLESEMRQKSWIISRDASPELLFKTEPEATWKYVLNKMGGKFSIIANYPVDPRLN